MLICQWPQVSFDVPEGWDFPDEVQLVLSVGDGFLMISGC
jgi:hypothetical protein